MAQKQYPIINNFSKGELSPRMEGRVGIQGYYQGCKTMRNCIMVAQGGAEKRPGTIYLGEIQDIDHEAKLIPFEVNDSEIYILEMGHKILRVWDVQNKSLVIDQSTSQPLLIETPYSSDDISTLQYATTEGKIFFAHQNYAFRYLEKNSDGFLLQKENFLVNPWEAKIYEAGKVTYNNGHYYRALKTTDTSAPTVNNWENYGLIGAEPTGDLSEWTPAPFSKDDIILYKGHIYQAKKSYAGSDCIPGIEIETESWDPQPQQMEWVWLGDLKCTSKFLGICTGWESWADYMTDKYTSTNQKISVDVIVPGLFGAWIWFTLTKKTTVSSLSTDPYWGEPVSSVPGGKNTTIVKSWVAGTYNKSDVVYESNYIMYKCLVDGTTVEPGASPQWESLDGNPFFSLEGDYPAAVAFMDRRLYLGGTKSHPQTFYGSKIGEYDNFDTGISDDDAFSFTVAADRSSRIKWMIGQDNLMIGTTSSEWLITGGQTGITPTNVRVLKQSAYGSAYNQALFVADSLLFFQKGGRKLREYKYSNDNKSYLANDLTFFADHITASGIDESSYQQNPDSILWNTKKQGGLIGLTYDRLNGIAGWHRHDTDGQFESVTAIDGQGDEDELWFIVTRQINGVSKRFVEYMAPRLTSSTTDLVYSDSAKIFVAGNVFNITSITNNTTSVEVAYQYSVTSGISIGDTIKMYSTDSSVFDNQIFQVESLNESSGSGTFNLQKNGNTFTADDFTTITKGGFSIATDIITGLDHLLGKTVDVLGDNAYYPSQEVVSNIDGAGGVGIKLSTPCNRVICGLNYVMQLQPESIELQGTLAAKRRISGVTLKLYNTLGGKVGSGIDSLQELRFRSTELPLGTPPGLFTGTKKIPVDSASEQEASVLIQHDQPLPMTVLAIISDVTYSRS